ncbi:MAG: type II secretion system protein [Steroidobacterales bacterium]
MELLYRGDALRMAIGYYVSMSQGGVSHYPMELQDLVQDPRWPQMRRYLRRVYEDPMTGAADWTLIRAPDGGIMGVASTSKNAPIKRQGFTGVDELFAGSECYCDWQFIYQPRGVRFGLPLPAPAPTKPPTITGPRLSGRPP